MIKLSVNFSSRARIYEVSQRHPVRVKQDASMHPGQNRGEAKKSKLRQKNVNFAEIGECINFVKIGGIYKYCGNGGNVQYASLA